MFRTLLIISTFLFFGFGSYGQNQEQVYAGVILHIMKYVEWPAYDQSMTVGVVNNPALVKALKAASSGKQVHYKNVEIKSMSDLGNLNQVEVIFFSRKVLSSLSPDIVRKSSQGMLIITEQNPNASKESGINFVQKNGSLKFELYSEVISQQKLKVSNQLKKYAIEK